MKTPFYIDYHSLANCWNDSEFKGYRRLLEEFSKSLWAVWMIEEPKMDSVKKYRVIKIGLWADSKLILLNLEI
jgi:hypothetical protein